jgi:hypothetical protein
MRVDFRTRLGDHAGRGLWVNRLEVAGGKLGQDSSPVGKCFREGITEYRVRKDGAGAFTPRPPEQNS